MITTQKNHTGSLNGKWAILLTCLIAPIWTHQIKAMAIAMLTHLLHHPCLTFSRTISLCSHLKYLLSYNGPPCPHSLSTCILIVIYHRKYPWKDFTQLQSQILLCHLKHHKSGSHSYHRGTCWGPKWAPTGFHGQISTYILLNRTAVSDNDSIPCSWNTH